MRKIIAQQLRKPSGFFGKIIGNILVKNNQIAYESIDKYGSFDSLMDIFEIGYGPGAGINYFLNKYDLKIDGIDFSELMYERASRKNRNYITDGKLNLKHGDFLKENLIDKEFDRVYFSNVTYFWKELKEPFSKIYKLLKKDGKLIFYMSDKSFLENNKVTATNIFNRHDYLDVKKILEEIGFKNIVRHNISEKNDAHIVIEAGK